MDNITVVEIMDKALKITDLAEKHNTDDIGELAAEVYQEIGQLSYYNNEEIAGLKSKLAHYEIDCANQLEKK